MAVKQVAGELPWSRCTQMGICGWISTNASIMCLSMMSLAYWRAPRDAWMITGASTAEAATMMASACSMLLMLKAGTP